MIRRRGRGTGILDLVSHRVGSAVVWNYPSDATNPKRSFGGYMVDRVRHEWWWAETSETHEAGLTAYILFEDGSVEDKWAYEAHNHTVPLSIIIIEQFNVCFCILVFIFRNQKPTQ